MQRDRRGIRVAGGGTLSTSVGLEGGILQQVNTPGAAVAVIGVLAVLGVGLAAAYRFYATPSNGSARTESIGEPVGAGDDARLEFEERVGEATLERLEPVAPDAVRRARELERERDAGRDGTSSAAVVDRVERELRRGLEDALAAGRLDVAVRSRYGDRYEVVNLPSRYRELVLPPSGDVVHVRELDGVVHALLSDRSVPVRDVARTVAAIRDHRDEIEAYLRRHEERFETRRRETESNLEGVRQLVDRLEGPLGDRVAEFVVEGRHEELDGVVEVDRRIEAAKRALHRCAFEDAERELEDAYRTSDELLVVVDFLGGVTGTIDHGGGRIDVPAEVPTALLSDLVPIVDRQYDVTTTVTGNRLVVEAARGSAADGTVGRSEPVGSTSTGGRVRASTEPGRKSRDRRGGGVDLESVADEVLYVFRELERIADDASLVEYQTDHLPEAAARTNVLTEFTAFCRRQSDLVETADLQDDAPPGFLTIEFTDRTTALRGVQTLRERFAERYAG